MKTLNGDHLTKVVLPDVSLPIVHLAHCRTDHAATGVVVGRRREETSLEQSHSETHRRSSLFMHLCYSKAILDLSRVLYHSCAVSYISYSGYSGP
jgi:hypothetical protein